MAEFSSDGASGQQQVTPSAMAYVVGNGAWQSVFNGFWIDTSKVSGIIKLSVLLGLTTAPIDTVQARLSLYPAGIEIPVTGSVIGGPIAGGFQLTQFMSGDLRSALPNGPCVMVVDAMAATGVSYVIGGTSLVIG